MIRLVACALALVMTSAAASANALHFNPTQPATARNMLTFGGTTIPVGYYEYCRRYDESCARGPGGSSIRLTKAGWQEIVAVNAEVNTQVRERQWHPSQTLENTADGGCLLRVQVAEPLEMKPWIRSWGAQVEVLAPGWLRAEIAAEMRQAAAQYLPQGITAAAA